MAREVSHQPLPDLRRTPVRELLFDLQNHAFDLKRQLIGQPKRATTAIRKSLHSAVLIPINDLVTRDP